MRVLILGASGVAGRSLAPHLLSHGHDVTVQARTMARLQSLADAGATPFPGDASDPQTLRTMLHGHDAVYDLRVSVPGAGRAALPGSWRRYARLRGRGSAQVVDAALDVGVPRVVRDTVTMVYAPGGNTWIDESHPVRAHGALAANLVAERQLARLTSAGGVGVAVRFGGFYGPDDAFSRDVMTMARRGRSLVTGAPTGWTSAIHTADVGTALASVLTAPAGIYNAVDDDPLTREELRGILADSSGRALRSIPRAATWFASTPVRSLSRSHRVSNARLRSLGWRPTVASRRDGWPAAFMATLTPDGPRPDGVTTLDVLPWPLPARPARGRDALAWERHAPPTPSEGAQRCPR